MYQDLTPCHFIPYEIKHDLGNPISTKILEENLESFTIGLAPNCNSVKKLKNTSYRDSTNIAHGGDDGIVKLFFGHDKEGLKKLLPVDRGTIQENIRQLTDTKPKMTIKRCVSNKNNHSKFTGEVANSWNLFQEKDEIFFIIDTGANFVTKILRGLDAGTDPVPNIHIINTPATCGDSATKPLPCAKAWKTEQTSNMKIYSWYEFDKTKTTNVNDEVMLSAYEIVTEPAGNKYIQKQKWYYYPPASSVSYNLPAPQQIQPVINNAKKENNITTIKKLLLEKLDTRSGKFNTDSGILPSWYVQRKRSGDYLQIKAAKNFPGHAAQESDAQQYYWLQTGPPNTTTTGSSPTRIFKPLQTQLSADISEKKEWYRKRTYFLTIDWPAFTYASYHGVNSILINYDTANKYNNIFMTRFD
tara:strand:+ start:89 stop:1330 length:1242 start_codon:yes stop_codon:yes gene_type:complete